MLYTASVLSAAFRLTALLLIPVGLFLFFLPSDVSRLLGVSPLWLARAAGGLVLAWGAFQVAASFAPDTAKVGGLVGGNLLLVASLAPAVLKLREALPQGLWLTLLVMVFWLTAGALLALLAVPLGQRAYSAEERRENHE